MTTVDFKLIKQSLIKKAAAAVPQWEKSKPGPEGKWSPIQPIYTELRKKGFTIKEAVDWLVREGVIMEMDRKKAEFGLPMCDSRTRRAAGIPARKYKSRA